MTSPKLPEEFLNQIPRTISMRTGDGGLPRCYHGSPLEMVQQMAKEMNPHIGVHEAIDFILQMLEESHELQIEIPEADCPESDRAAIFVAALVFANIARAVPTA